MSADGEIEVAVRAQGVDEAAADLGDVGGGGGGDGTQAVAPEGDGGGAGGEAIAGGIVGGLVSQLLGPLLEVLDPVLNILSAFLVPVAALLLRLLSPVLRFLIQRLPGFIDFVTNDLPGILRSLPGLIWDFFTSLPRLIKDVIQGFINYIVSGELASDIREAFNELANFIQNQLVPQLAAAITDVLPEGTGPEDFLIPPLGPVSPPGTGNNPLGQLFDSLSGSTNVAVNLEGGLGEFVTNAQRNLDVDIP